jgi:hypothetical protein
LTEYPEEIIYKKVKFLTDFLESTFEVKVRSHRAGRWGFNEYYAKVLEDLRYIVDCSVTPLVSWEAHSGAPGKNGGPDFRKFPTKAYFLCQTDISKPGMSSLLEVPMTIRENYGPILSKIYSIVPFAAAKRVLRGAFGQPLCWFRCGKRNLKDILRMLEKEIASESDYVEFMLHSSELMPGCSPNFPKELDIENLYDDLDKIFSMLSKEKVSGATCSEFYRHFKSSGSKAN